MKRIILLILMVIICIAMSSGKSEMLSIDATIKQAQEKNLLVWNKDYNSFGRNVSVNVEIEIPDVQKVPILQASVWMGSEVAQEKNLKKALDQKDAGTGFLYEDPYIVKELGSNENVNATVFCENSEETEMSFFQVFCNEPLANRLGNWGYTSDYYYIKEIDQKSIYAEKNETPLSDVNHKLMILLQNYYGEDVDYDIDYVEIRGRARKRTGRRKDDLGDYKKDYKKGTYYISFKQKVKGIPVFMSIGSKMLTTNKSHVSQEVALKCSRISGIRYNELEYMDDTSFIFDSTWLNNINIIEDDVPIASIDGIIKTLEKSIDEGYIRDIYAVRFGYVCYLDDTSPETYTLYPSWVCDCIYANSAKEEIMENVATDAFRENFRYEQIIIDAQTCEIRSGWISEDEGLFHEKAITW